MEIKEYLQNLIENFEYSLSDEEQKSIKFEGIEKFIFNKLNSSKFKAGSIPEELATKIHSIIKSSVASSKPIHLTVPFGGFKKWQLPSYPHIDWAEVFNAIHLRSYILPIATAYKPGVVIEYFSDEIFVSRMNNYPQADLDIYNDEMTKLLKYLNSYMPDNARFKFSKIRDQISQEQLMERFDKIIAELKQEWPKLPAEEQKYRIEKARRNYRIDEKFEKLTKEEQEQAIWESTLVHDAFIFGDWEQGVPWAFGEDMIPIGFMYTKKWGIHLKSSRSSTVQFWVGVGALEQRDSEFIPTILTYQQLLAAKLEEQKVAIFDKDFPTLRKISLV